MKISLTLAEIKSMVAREYALPDAFDLFDLEIVDVDVATDDDGWISNVGRDTKGRPKSLSPDTKIEVMYRDGDTRTGRANFWSASWRETDCTPSDIVAYRVIK